MNKIKQIEIDFFKSALVKDSDVIPTYKIIEWVRQKNQEVTTVVTQIPLDKMRLWHFDQQTGNIVHDSGRFFSIEGIRIETDWGTTTKWDQPIINQPEIGFLGFLTKRINGVLHFLMQAKIEPGNINTVQLSPTLLATKSNYTRVHKGKAPVFLEYFNGEKTVKVLLDQLQSEQGARFLRKRNRNIIIEVPETELINIPDNFIWVTLGQLKELIKFDNVVNMDSRTVISGIPFGSYDSRTLMYFSALSNLNNVNEKLLYSMLNAEDYLNDFDQIISWITNLKSVYELWVTKIPLKNVEGWCFDGMSVNHHQQKYFSVIGANVEIGNREVVSWDQPMIKPAQEGLLAFIVKPINGVYHFLVQAKLEAGNFDIVELAPTVQCLTGNYRTGQNEYSVPFIQEVLSAPASKVWYSSYQSEEGGRFYREQNSQMIVESSVVFTIVVRDNNCWISINQLSTFIRFNNYLNIAARSLISAISF